MIHLFYGDGEGKTCASIGLGIRAYGAGKTVCFAQFLKNGRSNELDVLRSLGFNVILCLTDKFVWKMTEEEMQSVYKMNNKCITQLVHEEYDVFILDEISSAEHSGLLSRDVLLHFIQQKADSEIIITGRESCKWLLDCADYISEIKNERHPYNFGVKARCGFEF